MAEPKPCFLACCFSPLQPPLRRLSDCGPLRMHAHSSGCGKLEPAQNRQPFGFQLLKIQTGRCRQVQQGAGPRRETRESRKHARREARVRESPPAHRALDRCSNLTQEPGPRSAQPWKCPARTMTYFVSLSWHRRVPIRNWAGRKPSGISSSWLPFWARMFEVRGWAGCGQCRQGVDMGGGRRSFVFFVF